MPYVRDSFWRGREFTSLAQMQAAAVAWCREVAGTRRVPAAGRRRPGRGVRRGREPALQPLPPTPFVLATWSTGEGRPGHPRQGRQDALLGAVAADRPDASTPAPPTTMVQLFHHGQLIRPTPARTAGQADRPGRLPAGEDRVPHAHPDLVPHARPPRSARPARRVIDELLEDNALYRLRAAQGVLGLADKHSPGRLEAACAKADRGR